MIRYASVCSGIEAASCAWHSLGWEPVWFAEIDAFPSAVLKHRWPEVPNLGDFTKIGAEHGPVDLLVGGTPCQSFSVAGLRGGLADDRGNLALQFLRLAARVRARWVVWENVPGVLSSGGGRDFGSILGGLAELGYGFAYRILDAQFFGVPQRRRRVFVVGYLGDWRPPAAVLFERASLSGDPAPSRKAREDVAPTLAARTKGGGGLGTDFDCDGGLISRVAPTLDAHYGDKQGLDNQHIDGGAGLFVAHSLRAEGFDASEDGTGRGTPLVAHAFDARQNDVLQYGDKTGPLDTDGHSVAVSVAIRGREGGATAEIGDDLAHALRASQGGGDKPHVLAFSAKDHGADAGEIAPTLRAGGHSKSHANGGVMPAVAFATRGRAGEPEIEVSGEAANALRKSPGSAYSSGVIAHAQVRRLTPRECERLQGFPDDYTLTPYRGKPASDGPRYKALGNSMAVPCMKWIGQRIAAVSA